MSISNGNGINGFNGFNGFGGYSNNGNGHFSGPRIENNSFENVLGDLKEQDKAAVNRRIQPSDPMEVLQWVRQSLREQREKRDRLAAEHSELVKAGDLATVGLGRLGNLVKFDKRVQYEYLVDLHRDFTFKNENISYALDAARNTIDETTLNMQFVGESLLSPLADRHKKIAVQKELGLRLRDTDNSLDRTERDINSQNKTFRQLSEGIQKLMNEASIKLPAKVKETINREDQVKKLAIMHQKNLSKGKDLINFTPYKPQQQKTKVKMLGGYGDGTDTVTVTETEDTITTATESSIDPKYALASTTIGLILGILVFFVILKK